MNPKIKHLERKEILSVLLIITFFVLATILTKEYGYLLKNIPYFDGYFGASLYIFITVLAVVIAPVSTFPLLPLAVSIWGSFYAAIFSIIGWTAGASIAFYLAGRYGKPLIEKMMSMKKIEHIEKLIPEKNIFASIILLRMTMPVDVLSYALGLFSSVSFKNYFLAKIIGVSPFAFFFSYAINLPLWTQVLTVSLAVIILLLGYHRWHL